MDVKPPLLSGPGNFEQVYVPVTEDVNKEVSDPLSLPVKVKVEPDSSCEDHETETVLPPTWQHETVVPKTEQDSEDETVEVAPMESVKLEPTWDISSQPSSILPDNVQQVTPETMEVKVEPSTLEMVSSQPPPTCGKPSISVVATSSLLAAPPELLQTEDKRFTCKFCDKFFTFFATLRRHSINDHGKFIFCGKCKEAFANECDMKVHKWYCASFNDRGNITSVIVRCEYCDKQCTSEQALKNHKLRTHRIPINSKKKVDIVPQKPSIVVALDSGNSLVEGDKKFEYMWQKTTPVSDSNKISVAPLVKTYECKYCKDEFYTERSLSVHITRSHDFIPKQKLDQFASNSIGNFKNTVPVNEDEKNKFKYPRAEMNEVLNLHELVHWSQTTSDGPSQLTVNENLPSKKFVRSFNCTFCPVSCFSEKGLKQHVMRHHLNVQPTRAGRPTKRCSESGSNDDEEPVVKKYVCRYCFLDYASVNGLTHHISKKHGDATQTTSTPGESNNDSSFKYPRFPYVYNVGTVLSHKKKEINLLKMDLELRKKMDKLENLKLIIHCLNCSVDFNDDVYFDSHLEDCIEEENFRCSFCGKFKFRVANVSIFTHIRSHFQKTIVHCDICKSSFLNKFNYECHFKTFHKQLCRARITSHQIELTPNQTVAKVQDCEIEELEVIYSNTSNSTKLPESSIVKPTQTNGATQNSTLLVVPPSKFEFVAVDEPLENSLDLAGNSNQLKIASNIATSISADVQVQLGLQEAINNLKNEISMQNKKILDDKINIFCYECKNDFSVSNYIDHISLCIEGERMKCTFCSNFTNLYTIEEYLKHIKIHLTHYYRLFSCNFCHYYFINHYNFKIHCVQHEHADSTIAYANFEKAEKLKAEELLLRTPK